MCAALISAVAACGARGLRRAALLMWLFAAALPLPAAAQTAQTNPVQVISRALASVSPSESIPLLQPAVAVRLPDDWAETRPNYQGSVWYRAGFDLPAGSRPDILRALYIERVCSNLEVYLNGQRIFSGGHMSEPVTRNCHYPQLISLPTALLRMQGNVLDLHVQGHALQRVASRQFAAGLSVLRVGPETLLAAEHSRRLFWNVTWVQIVSLVLVVLGWVMVTLGWLNPRAVYLGYFGWLAIGWALLSLRVWWRDMPWDNGVMEFLFCTAIAPVVALAVQFLLSYADLRSRLIETALAVQWVLLPATLLLVGAAHLFVMACAWYVIFAAELFTVMAIYLVVTWRRRRADFWPMALILGGAALLVLFELGVQSGLLGLPHFPLLQLALPLLFIGIGSRLLLVFARALQAAEATRNSLEARVREVSAEIERNFAQMAELRVERVTEKERKRIAADLHDDLGAKLLTIVHTSESERISTLAREALEEMRLSVRGLSGKPMRLADALADWRAETVSRLGQAKIETDWRNPVEENEHLLPARDFVQTTRILREAVSNIIKHSGATHCKVRCAISERQFGLTLQDNGRGISQDADARLDRGLGMSSMKRRAKQMQGQCLVESGPGYGTVIALTLPL